MGMQPWVTASFIQYITMVFLCKPLISQTLAKVVNFNFQDFFLVDEIFSQSAKPNSRYRSDNYKKNLGGILMTLLRF